MSAYADRSRQREQLLDRLAAIVAADDDGLEVDDRRPGLLALRDERGQLYDVTVTPIHEPGGAP